MLRKRLFITTGDLLIFIISLYSAFILRFEGRIPAGYLNNFLWFILLFSIIKFIFYYSMGLYRIVWEYTDLPDIICIVKATLYILITLGLVSYFLKASFIFKGFPRSVLFIDSCLTFIFISGLRLFKRAYVGIFYESKNVQSNRALIIGAGNAGGQLVRNLLSLKNCIYNPVGFIDDDPCKKGMGIHGIRVLGTCPQIPSVAKRYNIETAIIAMPSAASEAIKKAVAYSRKAGITKIKILPSLTDIINGKVSIKDIKDINPQDLLGRKISNPDFSLIEESIKGKKILVTGAAGSIGSALCRKIAGFSPQIIVMIDQDETGIFNIDTQIRDENPKLNIASVVGNIRDKSKVDAIFSKFSPDVVFHAAAYKHVPIMELYPEEAVKTNVFGTLTVAEAADRYGADKFVFISTDKAVNPKSVMGATKRIGEMIVYEFAKKTKKRFISIRFGNVLESRGNVFEVFRRQIEERKEVTVTGFGMERFIMGLSEAVLLLLESAAKKEGDLFIMDMGVGVNMLDFAKETIRLSGYEPDKDIPIVLKGKRPGKRNKKS